MPRTFCQVRDNRPAQGRLHIDRWQEALKELERAKSAQRHAETFLANAVNALGKWMMPNDAKTGETFAVWHGDALIQVTNNGNDNYTIATRLARPDIAAMTRETGISSLWILAASIALGLFLTFAASGCVDVACFNDYTASLRGR